MKNIFTGMLAALLSLAVPAASHAAVTNNGEATFWFTDDSQRTVVLDIENLGEVSFGAVRNRMPQSCRGANVAYLRAQELEPRYHGLAIGDYSMLRSVLVRSNNKGSQWAGVSITPCASGVLLICLRAVGGRACGVVSSRNW